jgi:F-type H+/Na+-transporting ATPase subunit alpha
MKTFNDYLNESGEVGYVKKVINVIAYVDGLPSAHPGEVVIFEGGQIGHVASLKQDVIEVLTFTRRGIRTGEKVTRTGRLITVPVGNELLGRIIDPFGFPIDEVSKTIKTSEIRPIEVQPKGIMSRKILKRQLDTGVGLVDLMVPIALGQRELVIGDRKTGKTNFLLKTIVSGVKQNNICIYAAIGKKKIDIKKAEDYLKNKGVFDKVIIVASTSQDPSGSIFMTPYSAMTIAEYFRDKGQNTVIILDDLLTHAKFYREISLLSNKFPGRNSYPGDIFYAHARLMERAGNFIIGTSEAAITCFPVVESSQGDFSGYIQTNVMSMTDGHIYFDDNLFAEGRRPAINPFISVTRVGRQTQSNSKKSINRELLSFMTLFEKMRNYSHFGAELTDSIKVTLDTGNRLISIFEQDPDNVIPGNVQAIFLTLAWGGYIKETDKEKIMDYRNKLLNLYSMDQTYRKYVDTSVETAQSFNDLLEMVQKNVDKFFPTLKS